MEKDFEDEEQLDTRLTHTQTGEKLKSNEKLEHMIVPFGQSEVSTVSNKIKSACGSYIYHISIIDFL